MAGTFGFLPVLSVACTSPRIVLNRFGSASGTKSDSAAERDNTNCDKIILESIIVYPIKSCAGFSTDSWHLSDTGKLVGYFECYWFLLQGARNPLKFLECGSVRTSL